MLPSIGLPANCDRNFIVVCALNYISEPQEFTQNEEAAVNCDRNNALLSVRQ